MKKFRYFMAPFYSLAFLLALSSQTGTVAAERQGAPIVKPGLPGEASQLLSAEEAVSITDTSYSPQDVAFMEDMIPHHEQALVMANLVNSRTNRPELIEIAGRIKASQSDEIEFMNNWLSERGVAGLSRTMVMGAAGESPHAGHQSNHSDSHGGMSETAMQAMGMATPEQLEALEQAKAIAFDRMFLDLMIAHHEGAVDMADDLLDQPGSAYDPILFEFIGDLQNDQQVEIERMHALLVTLSEDPRANLAPGLTDAGIAVKNLTLVQSLAKPAGFVDPNNPGEISKGPEPKADDEPATPKPIEGGPRKRSPMLSFSNTDMAFAGDTLVVGSYHGFNIYALSANGIPQLVSSVVCPGGQGDVSIVADLLIMSVQETRSRLDCGLQGVAEDVSPDRFRGVRIFDISDLKAPRQVGAVQTCRGSHTHSVVSGPDEDGIIIVYNSGTSSVREREEMAACFDESPGDPRTALFRIDVIEIPVDNPAAAKIVSSPAVFADEATGALGGLWRGGDHGDESQDTRATDECHDITVFPALKIAAGACSGNGILFDISDPLNPFRIDVVADPGFAYWHSATFNNDGTKVLFTDEWGGGTRPRCRAFDPLDWGADAIYDIVDGKLKFQSYFKIPAPQVEQENCVAHNGAIVPVPGRDIFVQAWYQGGMSVIDFTDSSNPQEIAYFDRGPIDAEQLVTGGYWSTYWYKGQIYATEIVRGLDVFKLNESEYLSRNEIAASNLADWGEVFNPQQQLPASWPSHPSVGLAYVDQLKRSGAFRDGVAELEEALMSAVKTLDSNQKDRKLRKQLLGFADQMSAETESIAALGVLLRELAGML